MPRKNKSTRPLTSWIEDGYLIVRFKDNGQTERFAMPKSRDDIVGIYRTRDTACKWAAQNKATDYQEDGIKKTLTDNGYHVRGPKGSRSRFRTRPASGPQEPVGVSL